MKTPRLPDHDHGRCGEVYRNIQGRAPELRVLILRAATFAGILLVSLSGEYVLILQPVHDAIGPLPGEPPSIVPRIVALSGMISVIAFNLYKRAYPESLPVRLVGRIVGYVALGFLFVMGLMLSKLIYTNMGGGAAPLELFGEGTVTDTPLLARFFHLLSGPFALIFGFLTVCNLFVAEHALARLREVLRDLHDLRSRLRESPKLMNEVDECEHGLATKEGERQQVLRGFDPAAAYAYANELASTVAEARAPIEAWITAQQLRKKPPESLFAAEGEPDIDITKLEKRVSALQLDSKVIYAAFRGDEREGNK